MTINGKNIYHLFQQAIPELQLQTLPSDLENFDTLQEWLNTRFNFIQYLELREYYDNGIQDAELLKQANVDTVTLAETIDQAFQAHVFNKNEDRDENEYVEDEDMQAIAFDLFFDTLLTGLTNYGLSLFVVIRENPYWFVLPDREPQLNQTLVDVFNETFADQDLILEQWE